MNEFDPVVLTEDLPKGSIFDDVRGRGLQAGAFGYIVDRQREGAAYIVDQIRAATAQELAARNIPA